MRDDNFRDSACAESGVVYYTSKRYTVETLKRALDDIRNGRLSVRQASEMYDIPNQTLYDKINQRHIKRETPGAPTVLTTDEEASVTKWVVHVTEMGFQITRKLLMHSVTKLVTKLDRPLKFKEGAPGRSWYDGFLKRNTILNGRVVKNLSTARVDVSVEEIKAWFNKVSQYLMKNDLLEILEDPSRIFHFDESVYFVGPKGQAVVTRRGGKSGISKVCYDEKKSVTLSLGASADGKLMPTLAIIPCKTIPNIEKYPASWSCGRSNNGWMTAENFYEYVANVFNPVLMYENVKKPVIVFLDGNISYLSLQVSEFCQENGIHLIALIPSSVHILHPMNVPVFRGLKESWRKSVDSWQATNESRLNREDFGPILERCINESLTPEVIQASFREAGLFPFDENAIYIRN